MRKSFTTLALTLALLLVSVGIKATVYLTEDFSSFTSSGVGTGWDRSDNDPSTVSSTSSYLWKGSSAGRTGMCAYSYMYGSTVNSARMKSPAFSVGTNKQPMAKFWIKTSTTASYAGELNVYVSTDGGATYSSNPLMYSVPMTSTWTQVDYPLKDANGNWVTGSNIKLVFEAVGPGSYTYRYIYIDDLTVEDAPTCQNPIDAYINGLSGSGATLNWSPDSRYGFAPDQYSVTLRDGNDNVVYYNDNVAGTNTSFAFTGLSANTTYTAYVRSNCQPSYHGKSDSTSVQFTTLPPAQSVPYFEDFDNLSSLGNGFYTLNASINSTASYSYGGSGKSAKLQTTVANSAYLIFPLLNIAANNMEIDFYLRRQSGTTAVAYQAGYITDPGDVESSFVPVLIDSLPKNTNWVNKRFNTAELGGVPNTDSTNPVMFCFYIGAGTAVSAYIDNVSIHTIPTCTRPENLTITNYGANDVTLDWSMANASNVRVYAMNTADSSVITALAATHPYQMTGLTPQTDYQFTVRGICSATDSSEISTPVTVKTRCAVADTTIFFEGAEGTTGSALPDCWETGLIQRGTTGSGSSYDVPFYTQGSTKHTGSRAFQLRDQMSGTISYLVSQKMDFGQTSGTYTFSYWIYRPSGTSSVGEGLKIFVTPTPGDTTNAVQVISFVNRCAGNSPTGSTGWNQYEGIINYTGQGYIMIVGYSKYGSSTYFDDLEVKLTPNCPKVSDLQIGNPTQNTADIIWTAGNTETQWLVSYTVNQGSTVVQDVTDSLVSGTSMLTVTGLASATTYSISASVRAFCGVGDTSEVQTISNISVSTSCGNITTLPFYQDFESLTASQTPICWDITASTSSSATSNPSYIWGVYSYSNNKMLRMYNYLVQSGTALINTPTFVLPTQPAELQFDYSNRASCGDLYVKISNDAGATFVDLGNYSTTTSTSSTDPGTFTHQTIDLTSYAGQSVILQFFANANYGNGAMFIDNIYVRLQPNCRDITGGATVYDIQPTSVRVSISDTSATAWDITYGPTGMVPDSGTIMTITGRMDTIITGLTANNTYDLYVRRNCGTEFGAWTMSPISFTCLCTAVTASTSDVDARSAKVTATSNDWELSYGPTGTTAESGTNVPVTGTNQYTITGLTPSTSYVYYVRHNCSGTYSDWSSAYNFTTTSIPDSLPFGTGFESSADDGGWHIVNGSSTSNVFTIGNDSNGVCSGSRALYMSNNSSYGYSNSSSTKTYAYRTIYFPAGLTNVSFSWKCTGGESSYDYGRVMLVPASETLTGGTGSSYSGTTFPNYLYAFDPAGANKMNLTEGDANGWNLYEADINIAVDSAGVYNFVVMWSNDGSVGNQYPIAIDNISISQVTCNKPSVLVSALNPTGGTVTASSTTAQSFQVAVSTTPIDIYGTVTGDLYFNVTSAPVVINTLQPNVPFYYTARAICGPGDTSRWATVQSARSACSAMTVPYTEGFEDAGALSCWSSVGNVAPSRNTQYHYAGTASLKITDGSAISPEMNVTSLASYMLNGQAYTTNDSAVITIGVMVDPTDGGTYTDLGTVTIYRNGSNWSEFTTYFTLLTDPDYSEFSSAKHFALVADASTIIYVDDLYLGPTPTCPKPTEISVTNVLANSCQVAWTNNATGCTQWIVKATPTTAGAQTITQVVNTNPVTITGLNPASSYSISMAAICSATDTSLWAQGATITTACAIVNAPYTEDFEFQTVNQTPNCWDISASTTSTATSTPAYVWGTYAYGGNQMIRMYNYLVQSGLATINTPIIALTAGNNYELRFDYCNQSSSGDLDVDISTDGGTTWNTVGSYSGSSGSQTTPASWTTVSYGLASYAGSNIMIRFSNNANWGNGAIFVDNVKVRLLRTCLDVTSLSGNIGANDVAITITDTVATHTQWQYMYGAMGFDTTGVTPTLISTDTFTITGLTPSTNYTVYVRAYCDATEQSNWTPYNFKTTSLPAQMPYICHFTDATENAAWNTNHSGDNGFVFGSASAARSAGETAALYVSNDNSTYTYSTGSTSAAVAYRLFRFNASEYTIHFSWKCTGGESYYDYARFYLVPATSEPALPPTGYYSSSSWPTDMIALDGGTKVNLVTSPEWNDVDMTLDMTNRAGSYYLVFNWSNDGSAGTSSYPLAVNDIEVRELTCLSPVISVPASSITTTSANVNYTVSDSNATVRYWYNTTGQRGDSANIATATGSPISLTNLSPSSNYTVFMQAYCSATDQSPIASVTFQTACGVINQYPYTEGFESVSFPPTCWTNTGDGTLNWTRYTTSYSSSYIHAGSGSAQVSGYATGSGILLATPQFAFDSLREYNVKFYMYCTSYSYYTDEVKVYVSQNPNSIVGATLLGTQVVGSASSYGMHEISYDIPAYTGGNYYVIFAGTRSYSTDTNMIYIDDVTVDIYPTCRDLTAAPTIDNTTATTMTVSVPKGAGHQGIIFAYAPLTATSVADTIGSVYSTNGTAVITGLTNSTSYKVYARGVCSATDSTAWTASTTGTTKANDCFDPQNLRTIGVVNDHHAAFTWGTAPDVYRYVYQLYQGTSAVGTPLYTDSVAVQDTIVFDSLSATTSYYFRVRGYCLSDTTAWVGLAIQTTYPCLSMPFICNFENPTINNAWSLNNNVGNNQFVIGSGTDIGSQALYISDDGSTHSYTTSSLSVSYAEVLLEMPAGNYLVSYDWQGYGESYYDYARLFLAPSSTTITTTSYSTYLYSLPSGAISLDNNAKLNLSATWQSKSLIVTVPTDGVYKLIAFWGDDSSGGTQPPFAIDNINIQEIQCMPLTSVTNLSLASHSAKYIAERYTAGLDIQYGYSTIDDVDSITWTTIQGTGIVDTIQLTGLTANTQYYLFVREICDSTHISAATRIAFSTPNDAQPLPFICSFEPSETTTNTWVYANDTGNNEFVVGTGAASQGSHALYISDDGATWNYNNSNATYSYAYVPLAFGGGTYDIEFDWQAIGESNYDYGRVFLTPSSFMPTGGVYASISYSGTPTGWIALDGGSQLNLVAGWNSVSLEQTFADSTTMNLLVYWRNDGSVGTPPPLAIDNISITKQTCQSMSSDSLRADTIGENMFTVHFYNPTDSAQTKWIVSSNNLYTDTVASGICPDSVNSFTATGLQPGTYYYVRLYSVCDSIHESKALKFNIRTACALMTQYPYDEGFENMQVNTYNLFPGMCWSTPVAMSQTLYSVARNSSDMPDAVHTGNQGVNVYNGSTSGYQILALPEMDSLNGKTISFWHKAYSTTSSYNTLDFGYINTAGTFVSLNNFSQKVTDWDQYQWQISNLPAGVTRLAFKFTGYYYYYLDDIHINNVVPGSSYSDTICHGAPYNNHGFNFSAGQLHDGDTTFTSVVNATIAGAADSLTTVNIYVRPEITNNSYDTICSGQPYNRNGWVIANPITDTYFKTETSVTGCDSTVNLYLYVYPTSETINDTICQGESYQFGDTTLTATGSYFRTITNKWGCSVTTTLNLLVESTADTTTATICSGESYQFCGNTYNQSGTYNVTTTTTHGCTVIKTLHLTVMKSDSTMNNISFCKGGSVMVIDTVISDAGNYTIRRFTQTDPNDPQIGCYTTFHVTVSEDAILEGTATDEVCEDDLYYGYGLSGVIITKDTTFDYNTHVTKGISQCDSVVHVTVKFNPTTYGSEDVTIAAGESYTWHNNSYNQTGTYHDVIPSETTGCDSVCTLNLTVGSGPGPDPSGVDNVSDVNIDIVPNPVNAGATAFVYGNFGEVRTVEILNNFGQVIDQFEPKSYPIEVSGIAASGLYYVRLTTVDGQVHLQKLVVK